MNATIAVELDVLTQLAASSSTGSSLCSISSGIAAINVSIDLGRGHSPRSRPQSLSKVIYIDCTVCISSHCSVHWPVCDAIEATWRDYVFIGHCKRRGAHKGVVYGNLNSPVPSKPCF
jgi:hypothetical protein